jgi:membrane protease YdiL (CAAX protease family)
MGIMILPATAIPQEWIDILNENNEVQASGNVVIRILAIVIVAPVAEEVIFRAGILKYFMQGMPKWIAIILAAMIFGSLHAGPIGFLYATFGGMVLGWLYTLFKSIIPTVIFHISYNAIQLIPINYPVIVIYLLALLFMIVFGIIFYMSKKYELTLNSGESEKNEDIQYSVENN